MKKREKGYRLTKLKKRETHNFIGIFEMRHIQKAVVLAFLIIFMWLFGCSRRKSDWSSDPPPAEKIAATNEVRKKLGIRQIKEHWTFYGREFGAEDWKDGNSPCKRVQHDKSYETILWEQDYYYTGRQFRSLDGETSSVAEYLAVSYDYRTKRFDFATVTDNEEIMDMEMALHETTLEAVGEIHGFMGRTNDETLKVADKILKMWGLERL